MKDNQEWLAEESSAPRGAVAACRSIVANFEESSAMRSIYSALALGSALLLAVAAPLTAQEKTGTNQAPPEAAAKAKPSAEADAVQQLHLAHSLIEYGRKNKAPEALITAARILAANGTVELEEKPTHEAAPDAPKGEKKRKRPATTSPKALLEEAKRTVRQQSGRGRPGQLVDASRGSRRPEADGRGRRAARSGRLQDHLPGWRVARAAVSGDGDTRLDLYIYDENGNLVTSRSGPATIAWRAGCPNGRGVHHQGRQPRPLPNRYIDRDQLTVARSPFPAPTPRVVCTEARPAESRGSRDAPW